MSFFKPPPPAPEPPPQRPRRPWHRPADTVVGRTVALDLVIGRSALAAIWIPAATVHPDGFEFDVEIRHRLDDAGIEHPLFVHGWNRPHRKPEGELQPDLVRIGIAFADGRRATNLDRRLPQQADPEAPPEGPVLSPARGGGGGGGRWHHGFWVWPLPPEGPLAFVCEWPIAGIAETRTGIDSTPILAAAAEVVELWPEEPGLGLVARSGGAFTMLQSTQARSPVPPTPAELTIQTERRTQLVDVTDEVRALVRGRHDAGVVVLFVPHTTAGLLVQAAGPGASKVAVDIEALFEHLVDESQRWQHTSEGDRNPWAHARAALTATSLTIPVENGELALAGRQRIFLCEFDGPRIRRIRAV